MTKPNTKTEARICPNCGKGFDAVINIMVMGGQPYEFGGSQLCGECRKIKEEQDKENEIVAQKMQIVKQRRGWRIQCGIPAFFQNKTLETFDAKQQSKAFNIAKRYAEGFPLGKQPRGYGSLILYSVKCYGVGKTHLLCGIGHRILDKWQGETTSCPVLFTTETDLLLRIRATYNIGNIEGVWHEKEKDIYDRLETIPLLLFDDVGKEQPQDIRFTQRVYYNVIDGRYHRNLPIVLTSNLDMAELAGYIGEASVDRLVEMAKGQIVEMKGESYRRLRSHVA